MEKVNLLDIQVTFESISSTQARPRYDL